jgi:hypothetical protein
VVKDSTGQQLAYVYFEDEPGRRCCSPRRGATKLDITSSPGLARIEQLCYDVFDLGISSLQFLGEVPCVYFIDVRPIDPKFFAVTCYCYDTVHLAPPLVLLLKIILHLVADVPNAFFVLNKQMPVLSVRYLAQCGGWKSCVIGTAS